MPRQIQTAAVEEEAVAAGRAAVMFTADWCGPCNRFKPHFRDHDTRDWTKMTVDISEDENPLWQSYNIRAVPTVVFFDQGKEVHRIAGHLRSDDLVRALETVSAP